VSSWWVRALAGLPFLCAACTGDVEGTRGGVAAVGGAAVGAGGTGGTEAGVPSGGGGASGKTGAGGVSHRGGAGAKGGGAQAGSGVDEAGAPGASGTPGEAGGPETSGNGGAALGGGTGGGSAAGAGAGLGGVAGAGAGVGGVAGAGAGVGGVAGVSGSSASGGTQSAGAAGRGGSGSVSIAVDDFSDYQVVQRIPLGASQRVAVHGSLTSSGASTRTIEARVVDFATGTTEVVPWTSIATASSGSFTGQLEVPEGGWYRIAVRAVDEGRAPLGEGLGTHRWGVGINVLLIGQSNMVGNGNVQTFTPVTSDLSALYGNDNRWKHLADPYDGGGSSSEIDYDSWIGASLVPSLANALAATLGGVPVGFVTGARGSSPLHGNEDISWVKRSAGNHADTSNLYGNSLANARAAGGVELVVMHQGETDATNETTKADYEADLRTLLAHYREDLYDTVPLFICQIGRSTTSLADKNRSDQTIQPIRAAQHDSDDGANVLLAAVAIDLPLDPSAADHYTKAGHDLLGPRIANAIGYYFGKSSYYRGPTLTSATYASSAHDVIEVHLQHHGGADFGPASGINGFQVLDDGSPVALGATTRKNATTISIALSAPISGVGKVRYLYGKLAMNSLSGAVHDDSALALPLEPTATDLSVE
jgi:hypothetical protein